ncbi:hypothetical protein HPP92_024644 [Vanilla planifolia]|uniref:RNase H type-1 domain-containing protein n=1 Tax=Vanilla planifolia TaxID=51239 RepID=A0A835PR48_VANPL|nr:hypothetical protein HPP92_024644 [Vanilla planifolia]
MRHVPATVKALGHGICVREDGDFVQHFVAYASASGLRCHDDMIHAATIASVLHSIWDNRNSRKHNDAVIDCNAMIRNVLLTTAAVRMRYGFSSSVPNGNPLSSSGLHVDLHWVPPPAGWIKTNYDAAVGDDLVGVGFIIRDHGGKPLLVRGRRFFSYSCEAMEVQAILEALDVVR